MLTVRDRRVVLCDKGAVITVRDRGVITVIMEL